MKLDVAIDDYLNHLLIERNLAQNTLKAYRSDLDRYALFCADAAISDVIEITPDVVRAFLGERTNISESSLVRLTASLRGFHKFAVRENLHTVDPTSALPSRSQAQKLPKALSTSETFLILDYLKSSEEIIDMRDYAILEFLYGTGARVSELCGLSLDDVDAVGESVRLTGKGNKMRVVPISGAALSALEKYLVRARPTFAIQRSQFVFLNRKGQQISRSSVFNLVQRVARELEIGQEISPHTLRHCYATHLLEGGADIRVVQELLGHNSIATTQIYTKVTAQKLRETYALSHPRAR